MSYRTIICVGHPAIVRAWVVYTFDGCLMWLYVYWHREPQVSSLHASVIHTTGQKISLLYGKYKRLFCVILSKKGQMMLDLV